MNVVQAFQRHLIAAGLTALCLGCSENNYFKTKSKPTTDERIRKAIDDEDFETARDFLLDIIEDEPENYQRYALLGGVYAQLAGFDLLTAVTSPPTASTNPIDSVATFIPENPGDEEFANMQDAINILTEIPENLRAKTSDEKYSAAATFQLALYNAAYATMTLEKFLSIDPATKKYDPATLATMTDAEAESILQSLAAAASAGGDTGIATAVENAVSNIDAQPGATTREKLIAYMAK